MEITVDKAAILAALEAEFETQGIKEKAEQFLALIQHTNPFGTASDGTPEQLAGLKAANDGLHDLIEFAITVAEKAAGDIAGVASGAKLEAVVTFLDEKIKLPFYLEILDGPAIRFSIAQVVTFLRAKLGPDWPAKLEAMKAARTQAIDHAVNGGDH